MFIIIYKVELHIAQVYHQIKRHVIVQCDVDNE